MNIFLIGSIHGRKQHQENYQRLYELVNKEGQKLDVEYIFGKQLQEQEKAETYNPASEPEFNLKKVLTKLKRADAVFAELSYRSSSAGFLVAQAVNWGKPVVVFYTGEEEPHFLAGLEAVNDKLVVIRYDKVEDLDREVPLMVDFVADSQDTRFNFFISPSISYYLDWISKTKRVPRSVYLRRLIDEDMEQSTAYWESQG